MQEEKKVVEVQEEINEIDRRIKKAEKEHGEDDKLTVYKQQSAAVVKKREALQEKAMKIEDGLVDLSKKLKKKEKEYEETLGYKFLGRSSIKDFAANLKESTVEFKKKRAEMNTIRRELALLTRTHQILDSNNEEIQSKLSSEESSRGIEGYIDTENDLASVSVKKAEIDKEKGQTLEAISLLVSELTSNLNNKKECLAPQIKELRNIRNEHSKIKEVYIKKKKIYDSTKFDLENEQSSLLAEVDELQKSINQSQETIFRSNILKDILETNLIKAKNEEKYKKGEGRATKEFKTWTEYMTNRVESLDGMGRKMKQQQKNIQSSYDDQMHQMRLHQHVLNLLQAKLLAVEKHSTIHKRAPRWDNAAVNTLVIE
eukprot:GHVL01007200.1.p1 GENE.GHVL01007200.1~~GHVL01007200.1.p1  ORF type:complete len:372 (-),score=110.03 GHVL01007200.1:859-1974(-)